MPVNLLRALAPVSCIRSDLSILLYLQASGKHWSLIYCSSSGFGVRGGRGGSATQKQKNRDPIFVLESILFPCFRFGGSAVLFCSRCMIFLPAAMPHFMPRNHEPPDKRREHAACRPPACGPLRREGRGLLFAGRQPAILLGW